MYRGDIRLGDTIDFKFTTRRFTTGAPFTLAGTPAVSAYVGNGTTQITAGITLTVDFDGVTGLHNVRVVASSGNGYATATNVELVITTGTVDSVSVVGEVVGSFSIENRSAVMPTTAARTLDISSGGEAGIDWANVGSPTTAVNLSATNIDVDQVVASVSGAVGSVTGAVGSVTGAVGSVASGGITATSIADGAIDRATFAADTGLQTIRSNTAQAGAAGTITLDASASAVDDFYNNTYIYLTGGTGAGQARFISDYVGSTKVATVNGNWVTTPDNTSTFAIIAFGAIPGASAPTVQQIVDGVWDEAIASHLDAGSTGEALNAAGAAGDPWVTALPGAYGSGSAGFIVGTNLNATVSSRASQTSLDTVDTNVDSILADTDDIQTRLPAALVSGRMDCSVGAVAANAITAASIATGAIDADALATDAVAEIADGVWDEDATGHQTQGSFGQAIGDPGADTDTIYGLINTNLNATISSRASQTSVDDIPTVAEFEARTIPAANYFDPAADSVIVGTNNDKTGYAIGTGGIAAASFAAGAIDAAALAQSAGQEIADEVLNRDIAGSGSGNTRNVRNALRAIRNRVDGSTGTLVVYEEDDTTTAWTAALTRSAVDPIVEVNP